MVNNSLRVSSIKTRIKTLLTGNYSSCFKGSLRVSSIKTRIKTQASVILIQNEYIL